MRSGSTRWHFPTHDKELLVLVPSLSRHLQLHKRALLTLKLNYFVMSILQILAIVALYVSAAAAQAVVVPSYRAWNDPHCYAYVF